MFDYKFNVRGYELDSNGHVNHAVYLNYFEQARWEMFRHLDLMRQLKEKELLLVVIEISTRYSREIILFDELVIRTKVTREGPYLVFNHIMYFSGTNTRVCKATVKTLFTEKGKMVRDIPEVFASKLL